MVYDSVETRSEHHRHMGFHKHAVDPMHQSDNKLFLNNGSGEPGSSTREHLPDCHFDNTGSMAFTSFAALDQQVVQDIKNGASTDQLAQDLLALVDGLVAELKATLASIDTRDGSAGLDSPSTSTGTTSIPTDGTPIETPVGTPIAEPVETPVNTIPSATGSTPVSSPVDTPASAKGPNGPVGSNATVFGPSAIPESAHSAPGFYVSAIDGSITGDGSSARPFATLEQAQQAMEQSNVKTTYVEGGTYNLSSSLNLTAADSGESFIADSSKGAVTLDGGGTASNLISINGANNITIEGFAMQNTKPSQLWTQSDWYAIDSGGDAIKAVNSGGDNFSYNSVHNVGIAFNMSAVSDTKIDANDISDVQQAINMIQGGSWAGANNNHNNSIDSNRIENVSNVTGVEGNYVGAIGLTRAVNTSITNNIIENAQSAAIEIQDSSYGGLTVQEDNINISNNTINNANTAALASEDWNTTMAFESLHPFDMGAIYVTHGLTTGPIDMNLTIDHNYITNAGAGISNFGIYLDDTQSGATVQGNIVRAGGSAADLMIHGGSDNKVTNNIFDVNSATNNGKGIFLQHVSPPMLNNIISDNIFYGSGANGGSIYTQIRSGDEPTLSGNDYWGTSASGLANETNAQQTDPSFLDPATGNYTNGA